MVGKRCCWCVITTHVRTVGGFLNFLLNFARGRRRAFVGGFRFEFGLRQRCHLYITSTTTTATTTTTDVGRPARRRLLRYGARHLHGGKERRIRRQRTVAGRRRYGGCGGGEWWRTGHSNVTRGARPRPAKLNLGTWHFLRRRSRKVDPSASGG